MKSKKKETRLFEILLILTIFFMMSVFVNLDRSGVKKEVAEVWQKAVLTEDGAGGGIYAENAE